MKFLLSMGSGACWFLVAATPDFISQMKVIRITLEMLLYQCSSCSENAKKKKSLSSSVASLPSFLMVDTDFEAISTFGPRASVSWE